MRRIPKKKPIKLPYEMAEYKPWFFWKRCCECGDEVRRETIYEIGIRWRVKRLGFSSAYVTATGFATDFYHFCSRCCISMMDAENLFIRKYLPLYKT
jgi:hypothetical protein